MRSGSDLPYQIVPRAPLCSDAHLRDECGPSRRQAAAFLRTHGTGWADNDCASHRILRQRMAIEFSNRIAASGGVRDPRGLGAGSVGRRCTAWNPVTPWSQRLDRHWSETVGAIVTSREALIGGILSLADQFGQVWADLRPAHLKTLLQTQLDDVPLAVGEARHSEWFYLEWVPLPNPDPFSQYAHAVAREMGVEIARRQPSGWCSWQTYGAGVTEADVMTNLASAALLADELPLSVLRLDEGYQAAWGDWSTRSVGFPHTLQWLAGRIRKARSDRDSGWHRSSRIGLSRLVRDHGDFLLRGRGGQPVTFSPPIGGNGAVILDPHPGILN